MNGFLARAAFVLGVFVFSASGVHALESATREASQAEVSRAAPAGGKQSGDSWRNRRHGGLWWYWLPSNTWVYWTGDRWAPYEPRAYSDFRAWRRGRSYSYPADQGNWGPIRYNRFGQPEYPYSQRRSGLRQLGPVPAMGGVRSLPGWGGER